LIGVSHLDLINWTNRLKWWFWELTGSKRKYVFVPDLGFDLD
jgi:triacylglycerol lipase